MKKEPLEDKKESLAQENDCQCGENCCCHDNENADCDCDCNENSDCHKEPCDCHKEAPAEQPAAQELSADQKLLQLQDQHLRLIAEFDNYRKRSARERLEMITLAGEDTIKGLLPIVDDFERALQAAQTNTDFTVLKDGVQLIYNKLMDYLKSKGVQVIDPANTEFHTDWHNAVTKFPAATPEQKGKIIDTVQKGYTLNDKVIRFANVVVGE